jgi:LuxR family maltose regulon positive regulatory protein
MVLQAPIWIARTKFIAPSLRPELISRPRLLAELGHSLENFPLTLVSAPAGSGKTTLLTSLSSHQRVWPLAWLALDELDNDPLRFINGIVGALRHLQPGFAPALSDKPVMPNNLPLDPRSLVVSLINEISQDFAGPFILVLDDLHTITDPAALTALDYFIERLPAQVRLVIATRYTPPLSLARLRARRQVNEIDLTDLQFTLEETSQFFARNSRVALSPDQLRQLHSRTQGWAAGLSLVVGSLDRQAAASGRDNFLAQLARTNRYIFDFLAEEILGAQSPALRDFLLQTSFLAELSPALCQAVTGRADAADLLDELYRRNLFVSLVDGESQSFHYHDLFKTFLRQRLAQEQPALVAGLHRRAAAAEPVLARRMHYLLAGELWQEAVELIEQEGEKLFKSGMYHQLENWMAALPPAVRENRPRLIFLQGACAWSRWDYEGARSYLEQVLKNFQAEGDSVSEGDTLILLIACFNSLARPEDARLAIEQALKLPFSTPKRIEFLIASGWFFFSRGDWEQTVSHLRQAVDRAVANPDAAGMGAVLGGHLVSLGALPGSFEQLARFYNFAKPHQGLLPAPYQGLLMALGGFIRLWRGDFPQAVRLGEAAIEICRSCGGLSWLISDVAGYLPVAYVLLGRPEEAAPHFANLFEELEQPALSSYAEAWKASYLFLYGRTHWLRGDLPETRRVYRQMQDWANPVEWRTAHYLRVQLKALLEISAGQYAEAEQMLLEAAAFQDTTHLTTLYSEAHVLLAYLYLQWGKPQEALAHLGLTLAGAAAGGREGFLLWQGKAVLTPLLRLARQHDLETELVASLLEKLGEPATTPPAPVSAPLPAPSEVAIPGQPEALTPREVEILGLLAEGCSNAAISERLVISPNTVKRHLAHLFEKLAVTSRTQALVVARSLGLV